MSENVMIIIILVYHSLAQCLACYESNFLPQSWSPEATMII